MRCRYIECPGPFLQPCYRQGPGPPSRSRSSTKGTRQGILEEFGVKYGAQVPVCVRINPHVLGGGNNKISTGHIDSKFGISIYQMPHVHRVVETNNMKIEGIHMHTGSDILDMETFLRASEVMFETAKVFKELDYVDFGSGFKVAYKVDDVSTDVEALGKELSKQIPARR